MVDEVNLIYYDGIFVGLITDDECFWYLYEWLSDSDGVCNIVSVDKNRFNMLDDFRDFNRMVAKFGTVELKYAEVSVGINYDDTLV